MLTFYKILPEIELQIPCLKIGIWKRCVCVCMFYRKIGGVKGGSTYMIYLLPCSRLYSPPYLGLLPNKSVISGIQLANTACIRLNSGEEEEEEEVGREDAAAQMVGQVR